MKLPAMARRLTRRTVGVGRAPSIAPTALQELAAREPVVVVAVGILGGGELDPNLPGEQRSASLMTLADVLADVPRQRAIVLHCG